MSLWGTQSKQGTCTDCLTNALNPARGSASGSTEASKKKNSREIQPRGPARPSALRFLGLRYQVGCIHMKRESSELDKTNDATCAGHPC